jgi:transposase
MGGTGTGTGTYETRRDKRERRTVTRVLPLCARRKLLCVLHALSMASSLCSIGGTMVRRQLDERQWGKIAAVLAAERRAGRPPKDNRNFIEAVLWWRRTGVPWRDLPDEFGPWKTVFNRFDRWSKAGRWSRLFHALQTERDDEWHSIDSTINRAHQHAAGGKGGPRSRE